MHICFVCTGNICRSPIAATVFRGELRDAGLAAAVTVTSAGTGSWHVGDEAHPPAVAALRSFGYSENETTHTARMFGPKDAGADLVVVMTSGHRSAMLQRDVPEANIRLLRSFDPHSGEQDVPDPYDGEPADYTAVVAIAQAAAPGLVEEVRSRLTHAPQLDQSSQRPAALN